MYNIAVHFLRWSRFTLLRRVDRQTDQSDLLCTDSVVCVAPLSDESSTGDHILEDTALVTASGSSGGHRYSHHKMLNRNQRVDVILALDSITKEKVVLKRYVVDPAMNDRDQSRAMTESNLLARCKHPNIVCCLDTFSEISYDVGDTLRSSARTYEHHFQYLVLEFGDRGNLRQYLDASDSNGSPGASKTVATFEICDQVMQALAACHKHNVAHRDIKSENVVVFEDNARACKCTVKLCDFGHSKLVQSNGMANTLDVGSATSI